MEQAENRESLGGLVHCQGVYIYRGQVCPGCIRRPICPRSKGSHSLPKNIQPLKYYTGEIMFDLKRLADSMKSNNLPFDKSLAEYTPEEIQKLGGLFMLAHKDEPEFPF